MHWFSFSTILFIATHSSAQNYSYLRVLDSRTRQVLHNAVVCPVKTNINVVLQQGVYRIVCSDKDEIEYRISHPEYQMYLLKAGAQCGDTLTVELAALSYNLNEVVITATRTERHVKDIAVHTRVITAEELRKTGTTNVAEAISHSLPGLEFYNEGRGMTFRLQGIAAKYTLFLIDGERIAGENRENIDYNRLNSSGIGKIEIVKGASSSLYGSSAMGGVINIISPLPSGPFESKIYSRLSKYGELETGVNAGIKQGKITSFTDIARRSSQGYDLTPSSTPELYTMEPYTTVSAYQKLMYDVSPRLKIIARGSYYQRERFDVAAIPIHPFYNDLTGGLSFKYLSGPKTNYTLSWFSDLYKSFNILERRNDERMMIYSNTQHTARLLREQQIERKISRAHHHLIVGTEYFHDKMYSERISDTIRHVSNYTILAQDELKFSESFSAIAGSRLDLHSIYGLNISPKISLMYKYKKSAWRLSYGHGYRAPSIKERFYDFDLGFIVVKGNENLMPERSNYFSVSSDYYGRYFVPSVNIYLNNVRDMIHEIPLAGIENGYTYANFSQVDVMGIDLTQKIKAGNHIIINGGYSYTDSYDHMNRKSLPGVSRHSGTLSAEVFADYKRHHSGFVINAKLYSRKTYTAFNETTYLFSDYDYPAYAIWKASFEHRFPNDKFVLSFGVINMFNHISPSDLINIDPGRRLFVSIVVSPEKIFKK